MENEIISKTKTYYDSNDADQFYFHVWGGEDIHIGIYELPDESIFRGSMRTVQTMASMLGFIDSQMKILDIGSGYGGAARYLASKFRCQVTCLNLSETENERNRKRNRELGLDDLISVQTGNFEDLPFEDRSFDIVWSEDALLHSGDKTQVFHEVFRVLKPGGDFIFTDPMQKGAPPADVLQPILNRIHLHELGSFKRYRNISSEVGMTCKKTVEMPQQLVAHYSKVLKEIRHRKTELLQYCSEPYLTNMEAGLNHWIKGGERGHLDWGILHFTKPHK